MREDPLWYGTILVKRLMATISLEKLWPWGPTSGVSITPARSPNEGVTDNYYLMTAQADWFGLGPWAREAPVPLLLVPTLLLLVLAGWNPASTRLGPAAARAKPAVLLLGCLALAALPTPVLITTSTAFETECFVLVHFLALAFLVDSLAARDVDPARAPGVASPPR